MEKHLYTLIVHSEHMAGLLNQVTAVFTLRQINIESLNVSPSSIEGIHRYTITAVADEDTIAKVTLQIAKKVDVLQASYFLEDEIFMQEIALYKLSTPLLMANPEICEIIRRNDAPIIETNPVYTVVEKAGRTAETEQLRRDLSTFDCLLQYVNSGRIAVTRSSEEHLTEFLKTLNQ
jgi:acetolactate synthase-1/3 small subunit